MAPPVSQRKVSLSFTNWMLGGNLISVDKNGTKIYTDGTKKKLHAPKAEAKKPEKKAETKKEVEKPKEKSILRKKAEGNGTEEEVVGEVKRVCGCCGKSKPVKAPEKYVCAKHRGEKEAAKKDSRDDSKDDSKVKKDDSKDKSKEDVKDDKSKDKSGKSGFEWTDEKDKQLQEMFAAKKPWKDILSTVKTSRKNCDERIKVLGKKGDKKDEAATLKAKNDATEATWYENVPKTDTNIGFGTSFVAENMGAIYGGDFGGDNQNPGVKSSWDSTDAASGGWDLTPAEKKDEPAVASGGWGTTPDASISHDAATHTVDAPPAPAGWDGNAPVVPNATDAKTGDGGRWDDMEPEEKTSGGGWNDDNVHATKSNAPVTSWDSGGVGGTGDGVGSSSGEKPMPGSWDSTPAESGDKGKNASQNKPDGNTETSGGWNSNTENKKGGVEASGDAGLGAPVKDSSGGDAKKNDEQKTSWGVDGANDEKSASGWNSGGGNSQSWSSNSNNEGQTSNTQNGNGWGGDGSSQAQKTSASSSGGGWNEGNVHAPPQKSAPSISSSGSDNKNGSNNASKAGGWNSNSGSNNTPAEQNNSSNAGGWGNNPGGINAPNEQNNSSNTGGWNGNSGANSPAEKTNSSNQGGQSQSGNNSSGWNSGPAVTHTPHEQNNSSSSGGWNNSGIHDAPAEQNNSNGGWNDTNEHANNPTNPSDGNNQDNQPPPSSNTGNNGSQNQSQNTNNGNSQGSALNKILAQSGFMIRQNDKGEIIIIPMENNMGNNGSQASVGNSNMQAQTGSNSNWQNAGPSNHGNYVSQQQQPTWNYQVSLHPQDTMVDSPVIRGERGYWVHNSLYNQIGGHNQSNPVTTQHGPPPPPPIPAPVPKFAPNHPSPVGTAAWISHSFQKPIPQPVPLPSPPPVQQPQHTSQSVVPPSPMGPSAHLPWPYRTAPQVVSQPAPPPTPAPQPELQAPPSPKWVGPGMNSWVRAPQPPQPSDEPQWIGTGTQNPHWTPIQVRVQAPSISAWPGISVPQPQQQIVPDPGPKHVQFTPSTHSSGFRSSSGGGTDLWSAHPAYVSREQVKAPAPAPEPQLVSAFGNVNPSGYAYHTPGAFPTSHFPTSSFPSTSQTQGQATASKTNSGCTTPHLKPDGIWSSQTSTSTPRPHLKPDNEWSQSDCEILEHLAGRHKNMVFDFITERFYKLTHRVVSPLAVERKFREDGLLEGN